MYHLKFSQRGISLIEILIALALSIIIIYAYGNSDEDHAMLSLATYSYMVGVDHSLPEIVAYKKLA